MTTGTIALQICKLLACSIGLVACPEQPDPWINSANNSACNRNRQSNDAASIVDSACVVLTKTPEQPELFFRSSQQAVATLRQCAHWELLRHDSQMSGSRVISSDLGVQIQGSQVHQCNLRRTLTTLSLYSSFGFRFSVHIAFTESV